MWLDLRTFGALREVDSADDWQVVETGAYDVMGALGALTASQIAANDKTLFSSLQSTLCTLGYYTGKIDGIFGMGSRASLALLLKEKGLSTSLAPISLMVNLPKSGNTWIVQNAAKIAEAIRRLDDQAAAKKQQQQQSAAAAAAAAAESEPPPTTPSMMDRILEYKWWIAGAGVLAAVWWMFFRTAAGAGPSAPPSTPVSGVAASRRKRRSYTRRGRNKRGRGKRGK